MPPSAKEVSDLTSNLKLEQQLNTLLLQAVKSYELLKKAKMEPFLTSTNINRCQEIN